MTVSCHRRSAGCPRDRYVVLIAAFQMLSAVESQWLDFLVFDRGRPRYDSSEALAAFIGRFTAISYGVDLIVLLCIAGWMLRRFGLRIGLTVHAAFVLLVVMASIAATAMLGLAQRWYSCSSWRRGFRTSRSVMARHARRLARHIKRFQNANALLHKRASKVLRCRWRSASAAQRSSWSTSGRMQADRCGWFSRPCASPCGWESRSLSTAGIE